MLMITAKVGERVFLGDDIEILVNEAKDGKARLGITAPRSIPILRQKHVDNDKRRESEVQQ